MSVCTTDLWQMTQQLQHYRLFTFFTVFVIGASLFSSTSRSRWSIFSSLVPMLLYCVAYFRVVINEPIHFLSFVLYSINGCLVWIYFRWSLKLKVILWYVGFFWTTFEVLHFLGHQTLNYLIIWLLFRSVIRKNINVYMVTSVAYMLSTYYATWRDQGSILVPWFFCWENKYKQLRERDKVRK